jgi:hypothetical protein
MKKVGNIKSFGNDVVNEYNIGLIMHYKIKFIVDEIHSRNHV